MAAKQLILPGMVAFNANGVPSPGATATLYLTTTLTESQFFADAALTVSLGSTITADGIGRFPVVYQDDATPFRVRISDKYGALIPGGDVDPIYFGASGDAETSAAAAATSATSAASSATSATTSKNAAATSATAAASSATSATASATSATSSASGAATSATNAASSASSAATSATAAAGSAASLALVTSPAGVVAGVRDPSGDLAWFVGEDGVTNAGAIKAASINGLTAGSLAKLLGTAPVTIGAATRYLSPAYGQSLSIGEGATADPYSNAGAVALTTDQPYGNLMFGGGVRPDDSNGLATGTFNMASLVPHIEAALTSVSDPSGAGETPLGGFQAMLFQLLNAYGMAPINVPFKLISFTAGQGATAIAQLRSGTSLFTRFMSAVTAGKSLSGGGHNVQMPWHLWLQGESGQNDDGYITQLTSLAAEVDSSTRAILTQQTDPVVTFTYQLDKALAAHWYTEAAKASNLVRIVGPMYQYGVAGQRGAQFDLVHRLASAYRMYGATAAVAVFCHYFLKRPWRPLQLSYNARGNLHCRVDGSDLIVTYDVPHGGQLAFDYPVVDETTAARGSPRWVAQRGFYLFNSGGTEKPLSDVRIEGRNEIRLAGASAVAGDILRVGFKDNTLTSSMTVLVNLRDCQGDVITFDDGGKAPVHNWALGEERTLTSGDLS